MQLLGNSQDAGRSLAHEEDSAIGQEAASGRQVQFLRCRAVAAELIIQTIEQLVCQLELDLQVPRCSCLSICAVDMLQSVQIAGRIFINMTRKWDMLYMQYFVFGRQSWDLL